MVSGIRSCRVATSATLLPSESQRIVWARCLSRQCFACLARKMSRSRCSKLTGTETIRGMCEHLLTKKPFRMIRYFYQLKNGCE